MNQRPLFAAAIGFVLGEVCAWLAESGQTTAKYSAAIFIIIAAIHIAVTAIRPSAMPGKPRIFPKTRCRWLLLFFCVFTAGFLRMELAGHHWSRLQRQLPKDGDYITLTGTVNDIREKERYTTVLLHTNHAENVLVYIPKEDAGLTAQLRRDLRIGGAADARGEVSRFEEIRNPGQFSLCSYYRAQDISMALFADSFTWDTEMFSPYLDGLYRIRRFCSRILGQICPDSDRGIFRAAILGEKEGMDQEIKDLYQENGISHLLAISGLHLSLIGSGLYLLLRKSGLGYGGAGLISAAGILSYGILTGVLASAMRAVIMLSVSFLAAYLGRTCDLLSSLSLALCLLAGAHPFLIGQSGFQLSFGAVAGIGLLEKPMEQFLGLSEASRTPLKTLAAQKCFLSKNLSAWKCFVLKNLAAQKCFFSENLPAWKFSLKKSLAVSLAVQLATGPIVLWHYFQYPAYGILLNLLVVPLMSYVVISGLLGIALGAVSVSAGKIAIGSGHYILQWYHWLCRCFSHLPGSQAIGGRPDKLRIFLYYLALFGLLRLFSQNAAAQKNNLPASVKTNSNKETGIKPKASIIKNHTINFRAAAAAVIFFCILCLLPPPQHGLDITVLDVGQGDGIVLQFEGGSIASRGILWLRPSSSSAAPNLLAFTAPFSNASAAPSPDTTPAPDTLPPPAQNTRRSGRGVILMDGGSSSDKQLGKNRLEPYLKSEGISWIDFAIVSHGDEDHISGLRYLLEECPELGIGALILPEAGINDQGYQKLILAASRRNVPVGYMDAGDWICAGNCRLTCFYPKADMPADFSDRNQQSLVIRADYQDFRMLFTGDVNQEGELMALDFAGEEALSYIQVLKTAHHGSRFSSGESFLSAVNPDWAIISYEKGNSYGHPHEETLERMNAQGIKLYQTGEQGAIMLHIEHGKAKIRTFLP